ncbi:unnamed protein product, partial [Allacma fusca]
SKQFPYHNTNYLTFDYQRQDYFEIHFYRAFHILDMDTSATSNAPLWTSFDPFAGDLFGAAPDIPLDPPPNFQQQSQMHTYAVQEWFRSEFPRIRLYEEIRKPAKEIWQFVASSLIQRFDHSNLRPAKQAALEAFRYTAGMSAESFVAELQHLCLDLDPRMNIPEFTKNIRGLLRSTTGDNNARSRTTGTSASQSPQLVDSSVRAVKIQPCDYCNRTGHTWRQCRELHTDIENGYTNKLLGLLTTRTNRSTGNHNYNKFNFVQGSTHFDTGQYPSRQSQTAPNGPIQNFGDPNNLIQFHDCPPDDYQSTGNQSQPNYQP